MQRVPALIKRFCDAMVEYYPEAKQLYWYHNRRAPELCDSWSSYEESYNMYKECFVCRDDHEIWEHFMAPDKMENFAKSDVSETHFYIRFWGTGKKLEWHEIFMEKQEEGTVLIGSRDMRGVYHSAAITQAVIPEFDFICIIDIKTREYALYHSDASKKVFPNSILQDYHQAMEMVNRKYIVPEEAEILIEHMRIEHVQEELKKKEEYILYAAMKDQDKLSYKKLYFSYSDATRKKLILIQTDVSDAMRERKLREEEERKRLAYLDHMPVACVSAKVFVDEDGKPYDFRITYSNQAYAELMGRGREELLERNFYDIFPKADRRRLFYYYETAHKGIPHVINWEMKEKDRQMLIYTFQTEQGHFGSTLVDITEEHFLTKELQKNREEMQKVLETTTDVVFRYEPEAFKIHLTRIGREEVEETFLESELLEELVKRKRLDPFYVPVLEDGFSRIREGEHDLSVNIKACMGTERKWKWYRMTMFDFQTEYTHERKVIGYLQNIDQDMLRQEELKRRAQMDALTKVMNAGAGTRKIEEILRKQQDTQGVYNAMFLMDLDDFKKINDTYGHLVGDRTLEAFGSILRSIFRKEDVVYRLGGDEFVAFVENIREPEQNIDLMIHRLNSCMEEVRKEYPFFSSSIGIYVTNEACSFEEYYMEADKALYETKKKGKSHYTIKRGKKIG